MTIDDSAFLLGACFCVGFHEETPFATIDSINNANGVTVDHQISGLPNAFVLRNTAATGQRLLELSNLYYELDATRYSHPDFSVRDVLMAYELHDYYSDYQPHTKRVIGNFNVASVWDFAGLERVVTVGLLDDGFTSHEDFPAARILPGYDFAYYDSDPSPGIYSGHGMACGGIIGASHCTDSAAGNQPSSGVISVAPHVCLVPVRKYHDNGSGLQPSENAKAIVYAYQHGADILSNSWGYYYPWVEWDVISDAIEQAFAFGRNGRGCPIIFASGNGAEEFPDTVAFPARHPYCLAVGAVDLNDNRWDYSQYGPELDIVAPSDDGHTIGVWSLDQMDSLGWNPTYISDCPPETNDQDYDCRFGGTSAACPVVAGTAALLLAKDSTLSAAAVYYILKRSAVKDLDWGTLPDTPHVEYGYGRVDAFRAILSIARGDVNNSGDPTGEPDIADLIYMVTYMFQSGPAPFPDELLADVNCDGEVDIADVIYMTAFMFQDGPPLVIPCFDFGD